MTTDDNVSARLLLAQQPAATLEAPGLAPLFVEPALAPEPDGDGQSRYHDADRLAGGYCARPERG